MWHVRRGIGSAVCALLVAACGGSTGTTDDGAAAAPVAEASSPGAQEQTPSSAPGDTASAVDEGGARGALEAVATDPTADRVVTVIMTEFAFEPSELDVAVGETVQFVFVNEGAIDHEAVLGDAHVQDEHAAAMAAGDDHHGEESEADHHGGGEEDGHHGEIPAVTVLPGEVGTLTHTFEASAQLQFGCHLPGHWDAGMVADVMVR